MTKRLTDILPLIHQLAEKKPITQGLSIGQHLSTTHWPGHWHCISLKQLDSLAFTIRYDLAVVDLQQYSADNQSNHHHKDTQPQSATTLETTADSKAELTLITHGLTRLRDLLARQVLVLASPQYSPLLHSLGFSQLETLNSHTLIWQFNILSYKQIPDWLNSKYWANPENWDKFRW